MALGHCCCGHGGRYVQIEEMYSVPESFLEIEVRSPQTHGEFGFSSPQLRSPLRLRLDI